MFNKLNIENPFSNRKQRDINKEGEMEILNAGIENTKLEITQGYMVFPYISQTTDNAEMPNHILKQALYTFKKMSEKDFEDKEKFLLDNGVKTIQDQDKSYRFDKIEEKGEEVKKNE